MRGSITDKDDIFEIAQELTVDILKSDSAQSHI